MLMIHQIWFLYYLRKESENHINSLHAQLGNFSCFCCPLLTFFKSFFFQKILSGTLSECQTVWIQIRSDILSVLIWIQTVCNGYQQMTKVAPSKESVKDRSKNSTEYGPRRRKPVFGVADQGRLKPVSSATETS